MPKCIGKPSTTKNYPALSARNAEVEKPCCGSLPRFCLGHLLWHPFFSKPLITHRKIPLKGQYIFKMLSQIGSFVLLIFSKSISSLLQLLPSYTFSFCMFRIQKTQRIYRRNICSGMITQGPTLLHPSSSQKGPVSFQTQTSKSRPCCHGCFSKILPSAPPPSSPSLLSILKG